MRYKIPDPKANPTSYPIQPLYGLDADVAQQMKARMRWELYDAEYFIFLFRPVDDRMVARFVPPPLKPLLKSPMAAIFIQQLNINDGKGNDGLNQGYHEMILSTMVTYEGKLGMWPIAIQIETDIGAILGREMFGTAKKMGQFTYEKEENRFSWQVMRRGIVLAEASGEIQPEEGEPDNILRIVECPTYHLHQVIGPFGGDDYAYPPRLMQMNLGIRKVLNMHACDNVTLNFNESPYDPICLLQPKEIYAVSYLNADTAIETMETVKELDPEAMRPFLFAKMDPF